MKRAAGIRHGRGGATAWRLALLAALAVCGECLVQRISPTSGSYCGGTRLSIYGSNFAPNASNNQVLIGRDECKVEEASPGMLVCQVQFRDAQVVTGDETETELLTVTADGVPLPMVEPLEFTFKAEDASLIVDFGPSSGQANDVLSFQGKKPMFGASVKMSGGECKVKHSEGVYLQCVPPPSEAGISDIEVYFGPERGFACPVNKTPPLKFTYNLALESARPSSWGAKPEGPFEGEGEPDRDHGPCHAGDPGSSNALVVVGQGLGNSTVFKLCGGDAWCTPTGPATADPALYHSGDWSFQSVTCRPGPLDPSKAPGGSRTCDLVAEAANGLLVSTLPNVWTYRHSPAPAPAQTDSLYAAGPAGPAPSPEAPGGAAAGAAPPPAPPPSIVAMAPAVLVPAAPTPALPWARKVDPLNGKAMGMTAADGTEASTGMPSDEAGGLRRSVEHVARRALRGVFKRVAESLEADGDEASSLGRPPKFPVTGKAEAAVGARHAEEPLEPLPPPSVTLPPPPPLPANLTLDLDD